MRGWEREARPRRYGGQVRLFPRRADCLLAGAVHVRRAVVGAPADQRSEAPAAAGSARGADVRLAAERGERQAGEVGEGRRGLTVAEHPEQRGGVLHRCVGVPMRRARGPFLTLPARNEETKHTHTHTRMNK